MFDKIKKAGQAVAGGVKDAAEELTDRTCDWKPVDGNQEFDTECGNTFKAPLLRSYKFCVFCGKQMEVEE